MLHRCLCACLCFGWLHQQTCWRKGKEIEVRASCRGLASWNIVNKLELDALFLNGVHPYIISATWYWRACLAVWVIIARFASCAHPPRAATLSERKLGVSFTTVINLPLTAESGDGPWGPNHTYSTAPPEMAPLQSHTQLYPEVTPLNASLLIIVTYLSMLHILYPVGSHWWRQ